MQAIYNIKILLIVLITAHFSYANFSCQDMFRSLSQWTKRDTLKFIDIPKTNEEQELRRRGHSKQFYAGVDEMNHLIRLGNYLREHSIDPQRTHIENFVPLIARHFQHLREGWQYYNSRTGSPRRNLLRVSKINADLNYRILRNRWASYFASAVALLQFLYLRKTNQPLSLEVWQNLNLWWAVLMQPRFVRHSLYDLYFQDGLRLPDGLQPEELFAQNYIPFKLINLLFKKKDVKEQVYDFINSHYHVQGITEEYFEQFRFSHSIPFPERILLPTTSSLGIFALNQAGGGDRVIPVELSNRLVRHDRFLMSPFMLFLNDLDHINTTNYGQPLFGNPLFHHHLMSYLREWPPKKREQAEIIYYGLIHEHRELTEDFPSIEDITDKETLLEILLSSDVVKEPMYIPNPDAPKVDTEKLEDYFNKSRQYTKQGEQEYTDPLTSEAKDFLKQREYARQQEQEFIDSLPPEIRDLLNQKDIVTEIFDNSQLLEESVEVFIQAVQHVLQSHPDLVRQ